MGLARATESAESRPGSGTVSARLAAFAVEVDPDAIPQEVIEKARACVADYVGCALEAAHLPWGRQAIAYGKLVPEGKAAVIGTELKLGSGDAAFISGALGHGLVREDMHVASCTHLGVVVWPALFALAEYADARADEFLIAGAIGYEVGARVGRALFDTELQAKIRPTGTVGAIGAAAAGARLLGLSKDQTVAAIGLAANMGSGVNEWPWVGGHEMVFHAGTAARNAVTAVLLAREGVFASPTAIEGRAGLFAAFDRRERAASIAPLSDGLWEIMSVYFKPAPACNYVQTPVQAALSVAGEGVKAEDIDTIRVASFPAAISYPGCDHAGPFPGVFEAKMSIQYAVAAVLVRGEITEANYRKLDDPAIERLARAVELSADQEFTTAYPEKQGAGVTVTLKDGREFSARLDNVRSLDGAQVFQRLMDVAKAQLDEDRAFSLRAAIDALGAGGVPANVIHATQREIDMKVTI